MKSPKFIIKKQNITPLDITSLEKSYIPTEEEKLHNYNLFSIYKTQLYNPVYSLFFKDISLNKTTLILNKYFYDMNHVYDTKIKKIVPRDIFIKCSPLLDPVAYLTGKYDLKDKLLYSFPSVNDEAPTHPKYKSYHNVSYVDCFFYYLSNMLNEEHGFIHGIEFYGSMLAFQKQYKINIADDYEHIHTSTFFKNNIGKLFNGSAEIINQLNKLNISCKNKPLIVVDNETENISLEIDELEDISEIKNEIHNMNEIVDNEIPVYFNSRNKEINENQSFENGNISDENDDDDNSCISYSTIDDSISSSCDDEDGEEDGEEDGDHDGDHDGEEDGDHDVDEDGDEAYENINIYIKDFPIQMICLEKCNQTFDSLFENNCINEDYARSALFQVIMILITYQNAFHFTHNDLHTNNIMYVNTDIKYLYYIYENKKYKVPTYGKIYKIIDYGRSIYKFGGHLFCSDSFSPGGDASTQYNFEPFYNPKKPVIMPNYSFDLCRLGCSIYDFIIDHGMKPNKMDAFQKIINQWCLDDNLLNVLYKSNGKERYENFKLYKMIARTVHNHTPHAQLNNPWFKPYEMTNVKWAKEMPKNVMNIDKIPCYV